jgi:hypothetical protein
MQKLFLLLIVILTSCSRYPSGVESALKLAGENRHELEAVLEHYSKQPEDSLKYLAACFLIENIAGHYSLDTSSLHLYRPELFGLDTIAKLSADQRALKDERWGQLTSQFPISQHIYKNIKLDIFSLSSGYLIQNIDMAFEAWERNPLRDGIGFEDFCSYVLPYRRQRGIDVSDWREYFSRNNYDSFQNLPVFEMLDSLLYNYKDYAYSSVRSDFPYLKYQDLLISKRSLCESRVWFNSMFLSSLGFPCVIDFVPAWGNRNSNHTWNAIKYNGETIPFEPFWDDTRWSLKRIYNNVDDDAWWGAFRLPKVFRYSYKRNNEGPLYDPSVKNEDIPPLFRLSDFEDVSHEYFHTRDVTIRIDSEVKSPYFYLCVFNQGVWKPVYWGEYSKGFAHFKNMGCNIVYLPAYYNESGMVPLGLPFILEKDGTMKEIYPDEKTETASLNQLLQNRGRDREWGKALGGGKIQFSNRSDFKDAITAEIITDSILQSATYSLNLDKPYRYFRFLFSNAHIFPVLNPYGHDSITLYGSVAEISCYTNSEKVIGNILSSPEIPKESAAKAFDGDWSTYIQTQNRTYDTQVYIGMEFPSETKIDEIEISVRNEQAFIYRGLRHELFYWNKNQWTSLGVQKATSSEPLVFEGVPAKALLWLRCLDKSLNERIFILENEKPVWW